MNIDDILASVQYDDTSANDAIAIESDKALAAQDLQQLVRAWTTERSAPELTAWPEELMDRLMRRVKRQIEHVEDETGNLDPKANFRLIIIQTELERFKYLIRSFLRARISKIDLYTLYYLALDPSPLSQIERQYAEEHSAILNQHYQKTFLSQVPKALQRLDDRDAGGAPMVEGPDLDRAVFVRCLRDMHRPIEVPGTEISLEMQLGDVVVVRWSAVKNAVLQGDCELV